MALVARRIVLAGGVAALASPAVAQPAWPDRPVRIIVPFPPGQAADIFTRLVADQLSQRWPQRVVVENRGGGAGAPAMDAVARSAADGYVLGAGTSGTIGILPSVLPRLPYDVERDFAAITNIVMVPLLLVAHPSFGTADPREMAERVRARPGEVNIASAGPASSQHMATELLQMRTGLRFNIVHYRGSGPGMADLVAGTVPLMFDSVASALPQIQGGRVRAIAVAQPRRLPQLPDVPTIAETLSPGYEAAGWTGMVAPSGTPAEIVSRISADVGEILRDPALEARILSMGAIPDPQTPDGFATFVRNEIAKWREVARAGNVRLDG
ncbi:Bug family tripartite tricarboxylate transporter substrate binding protein [Sabulicella glaciei]|uniref:Tripartite tricarboxylate transporter substrate binding protein n=1 Tax=Sabulicella glaciei TaxID=2984948 RepID=A0ABT3NSI7_9PROT|nr:tripartite tricarboxylate transporter substrate binding protein [Roseococcus sp. MDT2-1-1]MCW8084519.1 tripartite tricarboxylate transporter substrate binding protein [Roseococcus sp. MDT2-1-1]